jgi:hypothetical protein
MLEIYSDLFEHLKQKFSGRTSKAYISHAWQQNRFIQLSTLLKPLEGTDVHYEYYKGKIELHFEGDNCMNKYDNLINYLMQETENKLSYSWFPWFTGYRCQYVQTIENQDELDDKLSLFMNTFDELIKKFNSPEQHSMEQLEIKDLNDKQSSIVDMRILTLGEILCLPLSIPVYQRIYCWNEKNVKCLLEDIFEHIENHQGKNYRLGSIILHHLNGKYDIIDGQQRLVTLSILVYELGKYAKLLDEKFSSQTSQNYIAYNKYIIHEFCNKNVKNPANLVDAILKRLDFSVLILQNSSLDLAYTFFSNQNSRGVSLSDYDLLKAHHLRYIPDTFEQQSKRAAETWNKMIENGRDELENNKTPDYIKTLDTYIYHLRRWMQKSSYVDDTEAQRIKREYESAPIIEELPPFGERFYFNEPIQGGTHFFAFVERHLQMFKDFNNIPSVKALNFQMSSGSNQWYRDVIEALLFGYYLKFNDYCFADALAVIMRIILQHRYENGHTRKSSIYQYAGNMNIIQIIDQATSPTFFLAEAQNIVKDMTYPSFLNMGPVQKSMRVLARYIVQEIEKDIVIQSFKNMNL